MCQVPCAARHVQNVSRPCVGAACAACLTSLWRRRMCGMCHVPVAARHVHVPVAVRRVRHVSSPLPGMCGMCHVSVAAWNMRYVSRPCGGAACAACVTSLWRRGMCTSRWRCGVCGMSHVPCAACAACVTSLWRRGICGMCHVPGAACVPVAAFHNPRHRVHVAAWHVRWVWTLGLGQRLPFVICITPCSPCFRQGDRRGGCLACKWGSWRWPRRPGTRAADRRSPP